MTLDRLLGGGTDPLLLLLVQVAVILGLSRIIGLLFQRLNQPQVVGEMLAGIMLGPSLLGWLCAAHFGRYFSDGLGRLSECAQPGRGHLFPVSGGP